MRFASTVPMMAAALVAGASSVLANDSADTSTGALAANQDNAVTGVHHTENAAWAEIRHFVGGYNFFELLNYPGARERRHAHGRAHAKSNVSSDTEPSTPTSDHADIAAGGGDSELQPQERDFEDLEELEERKNKHKKKNHNSKKKHNNKKKHGNPHKKHKKKKHNKKKHNKKKHHNNNKKHNKKKQNKHNKKKHHRREDDEMDYVVRAYYDGEIDARFLDELVERYNVVGDTYLNAREFIDIDDFEARELGDFLWD